MLVVQPVLFVEDGEFLCFYPTRYFMKLHFIADDAVLSTRKLFTYFNGCVW